MRHLRGKRLFRIVALGDQTITREEWRFDFSFPEADGHPNPNLWPDPILALRYAETMRDTLEARDPDNAGHYRDNYDEFASRIAALDAAIKTSIPTVPEGNRSCSPATIPGPTSPTVRASP